MAPAHVLQGVSLDVGAGEIVCLVGRNGAGKTTTLRAVMGLVGQRTGRVPFDGAELLGRPVAHPQRLGLGYVPEERRIVAGLTVRDNIRLGLLAATASGRSGEVIDEVATIFPRLGRAAGPDGAHHVRRRAADAGHRAGHGVAAPS